MKGSRRRPDPRRWDYKLLVEAADGRIDYIAEKLGVHRSALCQPLTDERADAAATALGLHPVQIWPGWIEAGLTDEDRAEVAFWLLRRSQVA